MNCLADITDNLTIMFDYPNTIRNYVSAFEEFINFQYKKEAKTIAQQHAACRVSVNR